MKGSPSAPADVLSAALRGPCTRALSRATLLCRRFRSDERGATAIEFAMVAIPFFGLLFGIIQVSLVLFIGEALQTSLNAAARPIMTGEAANAGLTLATFKAKVCDGIPILSCDKIRIQVQAFTTPSAIDPDSPDPQCFDPEQAAPASCYDPGGPNDFVIIRAGYPWPISIGMAKIDDTAMLVNTAATRNESYQ